MPKNNTTAASGRDRRFSRKQKVVAATLGLMGIAGAAFAFWTTTGAGTGAGQTASDVTPVTVVQTSTVDEVAPGSGTHALSGTFLNPNEGPVYITSLSATVEPVNALGDPIAGCTTADYTIAGSPATVESEVLADDTTTWDGITVAFNNNTEANQDACKDAALEFTYTAN